MRGPPVLGDRVGTNRRVPHPPDKTQESANAINFVEDVHRTATVESAVEAIFMDMDGGTIVRIISGILFVVILGVFILRKRRAT